MDGCHPDVSHPYIQKIKIESLSTMQTLQLKENTNMKIIAYMHLCACDRNVCTIIFGVRYSPHTDFPFLNFVLFYLLVAFVVFFLVCCLLYFVFIVIVAFVFVGIK